MNHALESVPSFELKYAGYLSTFSGANQQFGFSSCFLLKKIRILKAFLEHERRLYEVLSTGILWINSCSHSFKPQYVVAP